LGVFNKIPNNKCKLNTTKWKNYLWGSRLMMLKKKEFFSQIFFEIRKFCIVKNYAATLEV
jgi:hypothetical protein